VRIINIPSMFIVSIIVLATRKWLFALCCTISLISFDLNVWLSITNLLLSDAGSIKTPVLTYRFAVGPHRPN